MRNDNRKPSDSRRIKRIDGKSYKFYLVHPPEDTNASDLAEQLISIKNVEEVFVTDGDYGFLVKVKSFGMDESDGVNDYLSKKLGNSFGRITSHYQYKN
ncbi:MAG: hypothetical protein ACREBH_01220 [Candidatus Micrarchaeaceae archaeon]